MTPAALFFWHPHQLPSPVPPVTRAPCVILTRQRERIIPLLRNFSYRTARSTPFFGPPCFLLSNSTKSGGGTLQKRRESTYPTEMLLLSILGVQTSQSALECRPWIAETCTGLQSASLQMRTWPLMPWAAWLIPNCTFAEIDRAMKKEAAALSAFPGISDYLLIQTIALKA